MNDSMGPHVAGEVVKLMLKAGKPVKNTKALMLGITFKENCPDIRNTRAIDVYHELRSFGMEVDIYDPWASPEEVKHEYGIDILTDYPEENGYSAVILAVAHDEFKEIPLSKHAASGVVIYDVKGVLPTEIVSARL